jgi:hypothetical protein
MADSYEAKLQDVRNEIQKLETKYEKQQIHHVNYEVFLPLFDAREFRSYIASFTDSFARIGQITRYISRLMCLRRVKGQEHPKPGGGTEIICGNVPAPIVRTFSLRMGTQQKQVYNYHFKQLSDHLHQFAGTSKVSGEGYSRRNMGVHRLLCHLTQNPMVYFLGSDFKSADALSTIADPVQSFKLLDRSTNRVMLSYKHYGLYPIHRDRTAAAEKIMRFSNKHATLGTLINNIYLEQGKKLIVFESWPVSQFVTETLLGLMGIPYKSMRADHNSHTRERIVEEFNDSDDTERILVLSLK